MNTASARIIADEHHEALRGKRRTAGGGLSAVAAEGQAGTSPGPARSCPPTRLAGAGRRWSSSSRAASPLDEPAMSSARGHWRSRAGVPRRVYHPVDIVPRPP